MRPVTRLGIQIGGAEQFRQVLIAGLVLHQQRQRGRFAPRGQHIGGRGVVEFHRQQATDNRLNAGFGQRVADLVDAEQIVGIGHGDRWHARVMGQLGQLTWPDRAFEQRVGALHPQMNETGSLVLFHLRLDSQAASILSPASRASTEAASSTAT